MCYFKNGPLLENTFTRTSFYTLPYSNVSRYVWQKAMQKLLILHCELSVTVEI